MTIESIDKEIQELIAKRDILIAKELAKENKYPNGFAIICLWCDKNKTAGNGNMCDKCSEERDIRIKKRDTKGVFEIYKTI